MKTLKKMFLLAVIVSGLFLGLRAWNDEDLFTTVVAHRSQAQCFVPAGLFGVHGAGHLSPGL